MIYRWADLSFITFPVEWIRNLSSTNVWETSLYTIQETYWQRRSSPNPYQVDGHWSSQPHLSPTAVDRANNHTSSIYKPRFKASRVQRCLPASDASPGGTVDNSRSRSARPPPLYNCLLWSHLKRGFGSLPITISSLHNGQHASCAFGSFGLGSGSTIATELCTDGYSQIFTNTHTMPMLQVNIKKLFGFYKRQHNVRRIERKEFEPSKRWIQGVCRFNEKENELFTLILLSFCYMRKVILSTSSFNRLGLVTISLSCNSPTATDGDQNVDGTLTLGTDKLIF